MRRIIALVFVIGCFYFMNFTDTAQANLKRYTYSYDIAEIEWQLLNWTAAWRGTTTPAKPFILDRMEYDRGTRKVSIYLKGDTDLDTQQNLNKSIEGIVSLFSKRFPPDFDQTTDIVVYYELKSAQDGRDSVYINYENGVFSRGKPQDSSSSAVRVKVPY
ncbi:MAG: hypothetical protein H8D90_01995 [Candidatus Omnitrophica bacterium]|nr:hypothetical protein [Candidatus Omnitrophota bacterium]MBL7151343.1 hypothetical protein [Candidatus Omnitrophota bacterium]